MTHPHDDIIETVEFWPRSEGDIFSYRVEIKKHGRHWVDFRVTEQCCQMEDGSFEYQMPVVSGFVKWDGCCEMDILDDHYCGARDVACLAELLKKLHALCLRLEGCNKELCEYE